MYRLTITLPALLMLACGDKDTDTVNTDTGEVEEEITYESGCFVVDDGEGYKYLNDAIAMASDGSQISPVGCASFEHEEKVIIDKPIRLVGIGQDRFTLVAPVNETAIIIQSTGVEISDFSIQSTRSGIVIDSGSEVYLHDLTVSEVGNFAIKSLESETRLENIVLWSNGDGALQVDGGTATATNLDIEGNTGVGIAIDGMATLTLSDSRIFNTLPTDVASISDGFGIFIDGSSSLISTNNEYSGNTLIGVQSVNGNISMTDDIVSNSLSTGVWGEGQGSMTLNNVLVDGNQTYGIVSMTTGTLDLTDVTISVDPSMTPSYANDEWESNGFGSMGLYSNTPNIAIDGLEVTGYNNCGANFQTDATNTSFNVEGINLHDLGRKGLIVAGFEGTMNNVVIKDIIDLDEVSSQELDENGNFLDLDGDGIADYTLFCSTVDQNIGALAINANLTVTNVLTQNVQGYGWSIIQSNVNMDTAFAQHNTCSSFIAFQGGLQANNLEIINSNPVYEALGAGLVGYASTLFEINNSIIGADSDDLFNISAYVHEASATVSNTSFTGGGIGLYIYDSSVDADGNTFMGQSNYNLFINSDTSGTNEHNLSNNMFIGTDPDSTDQSAPISVYSSNGGDINSDGDTFQDVTASYSFYISGGSTEIENASFNNISGYSIYANGGDHDISNSSFDNVSTVSTYAPAMYFYAFSEPTNVSISDVVINNSNGDGISATTYDTTNAPLNINIDTVTITDHFDDGIYIHGAQAVIEDTVISGGSTGINITQNVTLNISDSTISSASEYGINSVNSDITLDSSEVVYNGIHGIYMTGGTISATNLIADSNTDQGIRAIGSPSVTIDSSEFTNNQIGAGFSGLASICSNSAYPSQTECEASGYCDDSSYVDETECLGGGAVWTPNTWNNNSAIFTITNSLFNQNTDSGLYLFYAEGTADSNTATNNQMYGMECVNSLFDSCDSNSLTGNIGGEQTGCDETCGVEANQ